MNPRLAGSLSVLRSQINEKYPNRPKASDGWIGDQAHAVVKSEHNPNAEGVVTALDLTHDPSTLDCNVLSEKLITDSRVWYVIWNRKIWEGSWYPYNGENPHDKHIHVSVKQDKSNYDNASLWDIGEPMNTLTKEQAIVLYQTGFNQDPTPDELAWLTEENQADKAFQTVRNNIHWVNQLAEANAKISDLTHKLELAQATSGDASKWNTLKVLIKELLGIK